MQNINFFTNIFVLYRLTGIVDTIRTVTYKVYEA